MPKSKPKNIIAPYQRPDKRWYIHYTIGQSIETQSFRDQDDANQFIKSLTKPQNYENQSIATT
jgi:hypothetical protein